MKILFVVIISLSLSFTSQAQQIKDIVFTNLKAPYTNKEFYIKNIIDKRTDTTLIGTINTTGKKTISYRLKNGLSHTLSGIIKKARIPDTTKMAVEINFSKFEVSDTLVNSKKQLRLNATFEVLVNGYKVFNLSQSYAITPLSDPSLSIEPLVTHFLMSLFNQLDPWLVTNKDNIVPSAQVITKMTDSSDDADLLIYHLNTPLKAEYFIDKPADEKEYNNIVCSFNYKYTSENFANKIAVKFIIIPYMNITKSWLEDKNDVEQLSTLQGYFDIVALNACELKKQVDVTVFSHDNVIKELEKQYWKAVKAMNTMFDQYEAKILHEDNPDKKREFSNKIHEMVKNCGCYN